LKKKPIIRQPSGVSQFSDFEETKEAENRPSHRRFAQRRKRIDDETHERLKQVKLMVTPSLPSQLSISSQPSHPSQEQNQQTITIFIKPQRRYTKDTKLKAIALTQELRPSRVSSYTGIPESSLRRWNKVGISRTGNSGRRPMYPIVEAELLKVFKEGRSNGMVLNKRNMMYKARRIADKMKTKDFVGSISWLEGWKKRHGICYRRCTKVGQKLLPDVFDKIQESNMKIIELFERHQYSLDAV